MEGVKKVVNRIYCGEIEKFAKLSLADVNKYLRGYGICTRLYTPKPYMIRIRSENMTILLFTGGRFRCMGQCEETCDLMQLKLYSMLKLLCCYKISISHVSSTLSTKIPKDLILLEEFAIRNAQSGLIYEMELFPALQLRMWSGVHVNIFQSGSIVILGKNAESLYSTILDWIFLHM